ncbi:hypothetical protein AgCh_021057 [Apium graveolens]
MDFCGTDLCEDDLILPAHDNENVLKGFQLVDESNSGKALVGGGNELSNDFMLIRYQGMELRKFSRRSEHKTRNCRIFYKKQARPRLKERVRAS